MAEEKQRNGRRLEVGNAVKVCGVGYPGYNHISIYTYLYIIVIYIYILAIQMFIPVLTQKMEPEPTEQRWIPICRRSGMT